jgi:hypothetical protein
MLNSELRNMFMYTLVGMVGVSQLAYRTDIEYKVGNVLLNLQDLAKWFGADENEFLGLHINADNWVNDRPLIDIDKYLEACKVEIILGDVKVELGERNEIS